MSNTDMISDWLALTQAKARFCRALDTKDWDTYASILTEDYQLDISEGTDIPVINGREKALEIIRASIETAVTAHQVHAPEMTINGDEASVIWPMQDRVVWGDDRPSLVGYGHYHERWVRLDGSWKLAAMKLTRLHIDMIPPVAGSR